VGGIRSRPRAPPPLPSYPHAATTTLPPLYPTADRRTSLPRPRRAMDGASSEVGWGGACKCAELRPRTAPRMPHRCRTDAAPMPHRCRTDGASRRAALQQQHPSMGRDLQSSGSVGHADGIRRSVDGEAMDTRGTLRVGCAAAAAPFGAATWLEACACTIRLSVPSSHAPLGLACTRGALGEHKRRPRCRGVERGGAADSRVATGAPGRQQAHSSAA